jgi:hypothetical protein
MVSSNASAADRPKGLRPITPQLAKTWLLWLIAIGLLTLVAIVGMRVDRQTENLYITDSVGNVITDNIGNRFLAGREHRWDLVPCVVDSAADL